MAGDDCHGGGRLDGRFAKEAQAQLGFLAVPAEQRPLDRLGHRRSRLRADRFAGCAGGAEHSRCGEEPAAAKFFLNSVI